MKAHILDFVKSDLVKNIKQENLLKIKNAENANKKNSNIESVANKKHKIK